MAAETTTPSALQCGWCGSAYRRSYFDREHNCPACGHSLHAGTPAATPSGRLPYYLAGAAALIVVIGLSGLALKSVRRPPANPGTFAAATPTDAPPPFAPSADFREALATKAKLLELDLRLAPDDPFLIASLTETYLFRAVAEYQLEKDLAPAQPWLRRSLECLERMPEKHRFAAFRLHDIIRRFPGLHFNTFAYSSVTASLWPLQAGRTTLYAGPIPGGVPFIRRRRDVTGLPPPADAPGGGGPPVSPGNFPGPPGSPPGVFFSGDRRPQPAPTFPGDTGAIPPRMPLIGPGGGAPMLGTPGYPPVSGSDDDGMSGETRLEQLRSQLAEQPDDLLRADRLASELLLQSGGYQPVLSQNDTQIQARQRIDEAAAVYERAARTAPLRVQRAAFYSAAAESRRRLEQWDEQYELLSRAAENVPFAAAVWHELKTAALRLGKLDESLVAEKNEKRWRFPGIEPDEGANR